MAMTQKQRIMAAIKKQPLDKLPFGARIDLWYNYHAANNTLPEKYKGWKMIDVNRDLGAGTQFRLHTIWKEEYHNVEVVVHEEFPFTTTEYRTPVGTVSEKIEFNPYEGVISGYRVEPLFKSAEDYQAIEYLIGHTTLVPDYSKYLELVQEGGEDAAIAVGRAASPMQQIMRDIMGYEKSFYELYDNRQEVEHLYEVLKEQWWRKLEIFAASPAELPVLCGNWSDDIHTPVFKQYFIPWLQEATEFLHAHGKAAMLHTDGELRRLLPFVLEIGADVAECWSAAPMTSTTAADLKEAWGEGIAVWGGIASQLFEPMYSDEEFDDYVLNIFREMAPGNRYIVGMGENFPIDGKIERVRRVSELIDQYGTVPVRI